MKKLNLLFIFAILLLSVSASYCAGTKNLLTNPDFESDDLSVWAARGGEISRSDTPVFNGTYSLKITERTKNDDGVFQDITAQVAPGYVYTVSGQTRTGEETGWDKLAVYLVLNKNAEDKQIFLGSSDENNTSWSHFSYKFTVPEENEISAFGLLFRPSFSTTDFYLDDLLLEPSIQIKTSSAEKTSRLSVNIGPLTDNQKGLKAEVKVQDVLDNNVFTLSLNLAKDTLINLENGFYRASADVTDAHEKTVSVEKTFCAGDLDENIASLIKANQEMTASDAKAAYHGWLRYLQYLLEDAKERFFENTEGTTDAAYRLDKWMTKIKEDPDLISKLNAVIEWAYLSKVDDSGQPFKLAIPTDYTPDKSFALEVNLHGHGGNHLEYSGGVQSRPGTFHLEVLGRARGGGFFDLSEVDVLDAVEYIKKYWNIDPQRIHLVGTSMGGWGTYYLCARHPHIFASARPQCGAGTVLPIKNLLNVPVYATHSIDDDTVPILQDRIPVQNLIRFGGKAVMDETSGLGHAAWNYHEGNARAYEFAFSQILPNMRDVRRIHYTAIDGLARRAYWLEVVEWGHKPRPAVMDARVDEANMLYLNLENINTLKVDVSRSPINAKENLKVVVNAHAPITYNAPLSETLYARLQDNDWVISDDLGEIKPYRLHYPGGVHLLYQGEPLLIVWGTQSDTDTNKRIYDAAQAARKNPNPNWHDSDAQEPGEGEGIDGIPHNRMLYSTLLGKPDYEITEEDMKKYNLVLIGTAEQNSIVAEIADKLPVQLKQNSIKCSDGIDWGIRNAAIGLSFYNPKAPKRLIFWVACNNPEFYQPESKVLQRMVLSDVVPDMVVASLKNEEVVASRFFDSHWQWEPGYEKSRFCSPHIRTNKQMAKEMAKVLRRATGSDVSLVYIPENPDDLLPSAGLKRIADLTADNYYLPVAEMTLTGKELLAYQEWLKQNPPEYGGWIEFYPKIIKLAFRENELYKVSLYPYVLWDMADITIQYPPHEYKITDMQAIDVIEQYFPTSLPTHRRD